jgi:predicted transcriptional regulator
MYEKPSKPTWVRLSVTAVKGLEKIADEEQRSVSSVIRQAVKEYLERRRIIQRRF